MVESNTSVTTKINYVAIDLKQGSVIVQSGESSLNDYCKKAEEIAKRLTSNANPAEWGIT